MINYLLLIHMQLWAGSIPATPNIISNTTAVISNGYFKELMLMGLIFIYALLGTIGGLVIKDMT